MPSSAPSKPTMAASEKAEFEPSGCGIVMPSRIEADGGEGQADPLALADLEAEDAIGHHGDEHDAAGEDDLDDRQRHQRDRRHVQAPGPATDAMPIVNQREEYSALAVRSGCLTSTAGASQAPRCLKKKLRFEATAHRSASRMPS